MMASSSSHAELANSSMASYAAPRKFSEISIEELPEVLAVAKDSLDPTADLEAWMQILEAVSEQQKTRQRQRDEWSEKLNAMSSNLATLRATQPRSSWRSQDAHSQQLAAQGQRTLELAKQIAKLESAISRAETDMRECRTELERIDRGDPLSADDEAAEGRSNGQGEAEDAEEEEEEEETWGEKALGRHSLALTMFRQLGFQPLRSATDPSMADGGISTLFARSDSKGKVTPFKVGDGPSSSTSGLSGQASSNAGWTRMTEADRVQLVNAMWDAVE